MFKRINYDIAVHFLKANSGLLKIHALYRVVQKNRTNLNHARKKSDIDFKRSSYEVRPFGRSLLNVHQY